MKPLRCLLESTRLCRRWVMWMKWWAVSSVAEMNYIRIDLHSRDRESENIRLDDLNHLFFIAQLQSMHLEVLQAYLIAASICRSPHCKDTPAASICFNTTTSTQDRSATEGHHSLARVRRDSELHQAPPLAS
jgi:hypothetical protein